MMPMTQVHAEKIANKLGAEFEEGRKHKKIKVRYCGKVIARFNIRRASRQVRHGFIPDQLHISRKKVMELADCSMTKEAYFEALREIGMIGQDFSD